MTKRPNRVLLAVLGVAVLLGVYLLIWKPRADDIAAARSDRDELASELALARASTPHTPPTTNAAADAALSVAIPSTPDLANLLRQIRRRSGPASASTSMPSRPALSPGSGPWPVARWR